MNALSPAKVDAVKLSKKESRATVSVPEDQLSLAIGTGGQNVRLASKLTGWNLDIEKTPEIKEEKSKEKIEKDNIDTDVSIDKDTEKPKEEPKKAKKPKKTKKI
jgi:N utilization substance protein A